VARDGRRRQPYHNDDHALSRASFGVIEISKATLCRERKVAFFITARRRFSRGPCAQFELGERVCCESVGP
jgi:hypothetical protein